MHSTEKHQTDSPKNSKGLVGNRGNFALMEKRIKGNIRTRLGFISGGWNNFEACCFFQKKYWMGGAGIAKVKAVDVLYYWLGLNNTPKNHQCYADRKKQIVNFPPPPEPIN